MPYKFGDYVSVYVDPQSVKISETLRNRFMENYKANDTLALAVDQMKAALPFENDVKRKNELQQQINEKLDALSDRGDYENLGFAVHRASKEFSEAYSPIKENYERYQAAIAAIDEQYKKGDINSDQYNRAASYITKGYKGFEIDPTTGRAKAGTMFTAPTIVKDPKIMDLMTKRLEILEMKERGYQEGSIVVDENGTFKRKVGEYTKEIPEEDVMQVYNAVIKEPDVAAYLKQMSDMKTYDSDRSGQTQITLQNAKAEYEKKITDLQTQAGLETDEAKRAQYQTAITALKDANTKIDAALQNPALASDMMREYHQEEILRPVKEYAMKKAGLFSYKEAESLDNGGTGKDGSGSGGGSIPMVQWWNYDQVRADMDISGTDHKSKMAYLADTDQKIAAITKEIADNPEYSDIVKGQLQSNLNTLINNKSRVQSQLKEAADAAVSMADLQSVDSKITGVVKSMFPQYSSGELYTEIQRIFDNPGDQDYMNFKAAFDKQYGEGSFNSHVTSGQYSGTTGQSRLGQEQGKYGETLSVSTVFTNTLGNKVNAKYAEIKTANAFNMGLIETGIDKKTNIATTKAVHGFFEGRPLNQEEQVTIMLPNGTVKQVHGGDPLLQGYKIQQVGWMPGNNTFKVNFVKEGDESGVMTGIYDGSQIKNEGLMSALNNPEVRFGTLVMQQKSSEPGIHRTLNTIKINGEEVLVNIYSRGDDPPYISITYKDGTPFLDSDKEKRDADGKIIKEGKATKHNLDEPAIKNLINSGYVTGF